MGSVTQGPGFQSKPPRRLRPLGPLGSSRSQHRRTPMFFLWKGHASFRITSGPPCGFPPVCVCRCPARWRSCGAVGGRQGHRSWMGWWERRAGSLSRSRSSSIGPRTARGHNFWICRLNAQGQVKYLKISRAWCGTSVRLLLCVASIDLWFHREGASGVSSMYLHCQADQSSAICTGMSGL